MGSNMEKKKVERLDYIEEGNKTRQAINDERLKVQKIRQQKISHIEDMGIDPKY
jgi:predicted GIY-YIG superfamily endonuclease